MAKRTSRRQFLKTGLAGGLALFTPPLLQAAPRPTAARVPVPERVLQAVTQQPFTALPSTLPLGQPLADIAMGWDGSVWGIDTSGVPHQYNTVAQTWQIYGSGVDAISQSLASGSGLRAAVLGSEVSIAGAAPVSLATAWPGLPASFAQGLDGIAAANNTLYLFRHGRYLALNPTANAPASTPLQLIGLPGWPTSGTFASGAVDAVGSNPNDTGSPQVTLWANGEMLTIDVVQGRVVAGPVPISTLVSGQMLTIMQQGFSAVLYDPDPVEGFVRVFQGPVVWNSWNTSGTIGSSYIATEYLGANVPWAPTLAHAPVGTIGGLWAAGSGGQQYQPLYHDGTSWQVGPSLSGTGNYDHLGVAVGQDGTVVGLIGTSSGTALVQLSSDGSAWDALASTPANTVQVSAGDSDHVWVRDSANGVSRVSGGSSSAVNLGQSATHIAANADGTLWHAGGTANAYRFISEGTAPSTALTVGSSGTVTSVAATGFGTAFVLAAGGVASAQTGGGPQLYSYDSPYAWKTSASYFLSPDAQYAPANVALGGTSAFLFTTQLVNTYTAQGLVVALDPQSGAEVWPQPYALPAVDGLPSGSLVYDATLALVYVATASTIVALRAVDGTAVWSYDAGGNLDPMYARLGVLALGSGVLGVGRSDGAVVLIDTHAALVSAQSNQPVAPLWTSASLLTPSGGSDPVNIGAPVFDSNGTVYIQSQLQGGTGGVRWYQPTVLALDPATGAALWTTPLPQTTTQQGSYSPADILVGTTTDQRTDIVGAPAVFVNAGAAVFALDPVDGSQISFFGLPGYAPPPGSGANTITSALAYANGQLFFGDAGGTLRVVDATTLTLTTATTDTVATTYGVLGQPVLVSDGDAGSGVVALFTRGDTNVYVFDPDSGTIETIATDLSLSLHLAYDALHGLLYTLGWNPDSEALNQVFALRPDSAIQAERAFIIESQLMQDYGSDTEAGGDGVARYQTHVSIVDSNNAAQNNVAIKLWADADATAVTLDGTAYTIGPDTPALFTTDGTGTFTILSDASDLTTITLRLWAAFMDASERITITPDAEFHQRLAAATATGATDPRQLDMVSAVGYDGTQLFSTSNQSQAQQAAQACTTTLGAVGVGAAPSAQFRRTAGGTVWLTQAPTPPKYTVYTNLPGMAYSAINAGANLALNVVSPVGLSLSSSGLTVLAPGQAASLIDGLQGAAPSGALLGSLFSDLKSAWDEIKKTAATVSQVVISVAREVYIGIQYVANRITKVVKAVAHDVIDALTAIGSFFVELGKLLPQLLEALSVLLHLDEIITTANIIQAQMTTALTNLGTTLAQGKATCDTFFGNAEANIKSNFCQVFALLDLPTAPGCPPTGTASGAAGTPLASINGMGATPTTVYNTGQGGPSQAVPCGWSNHVLRTNMYNGSTPSSLTDTPSFESIMSAFFDSLSTNPQLSAAWSDVGTSFRATFQVGSAKDFLAMALEDLLEIIEALLITGVAVVQALIDSVLSPTNLAAIVGTIQNLGTVTIPVLSTLWQRFTGNALTFLDLFALVLAFPVTFMYRAFSGYYPSVSKGVQTPQVRSSLLGAALPTEPTMVKNVLGLVAAGAMLTGGWVQGFLDAVYVTGGPDGNGARDYGFGYLNKLRTVISLVQVIGSLGWGQVDAPSSEEHEIVMDMVSVLRICNGVFAGNDPQPGAAVVASYLGSLLAAFAIIETGTHYVPSDPSNKLVLARSILGQVPGFVNPVKTWGTAEELYPFIPACADAAFGEATAGLMAAQVLETMLTGANEVGVYRWHLPTMTNP